MIRPVLLEFIWLPSFERSARGWLTFEDRRSIEARLCEDPRAGALMPRTGGFRKLRMGMSGRGKSGGARIVYLIDSGASRIFMILAYPKSTTATLSGKYEGELRRLASELKEGG